MQPKREIYENVSTGNKMLQRYEGGLSVVLFFEDNFQLMPVSNNEAINGCAKRSVGEEQKSSMSLTR